MSAQPLTAGLPPNCHLSAGFTLRLTALDPTTGATVSGVQLSEILFLVADVGAPAGTSSSDAPLPLLVPSDEVA